MSVYKQTYEHRASKFTNPAAKQLLETIVRKQSNLCVSVDVSKSSDFLAVIDVCGPYVCLVKARIFSSPLHLFFAVRRDE